MKTKKLICHVCNKEYNQKDRIFCDCGGNLEIKYDSKNISIKNDSENMWGFFENLPLEDESNIVSLQEGLTPLIESEKIAEEINIENLYLKDETRNPTGSFKDRPLSIGVSKAKEFGKDTILIASSGNASTSAAAYAAKADMSCKIFVPESTPIGKLAQAKAYGGEIIKVKGNYSRAYAAARQASKKYGWYNVTTTYLNPYTVEGNKTVAYELFNQVGVPDLVFVPVGAGPLLFGVLKGYKELLNADIINKTPRMVAVQPAGCSPIVNAYENKKDKVESWDKEINTIASGINDPLKGYQQDGTITLKAVYESSGWCVKMSDEEILESIFSLGENEGIFAEPAGAAGLGGVKKLLEQNEIHSQNKAVVLVTGHGLKDTSSISIEELEIIKDINDLN